MNAIQVGLEVPLDRFYIQRESSMDTDVKTLSFNFLICCYFGQSENLGKAAIDRAYVDMASHTINIDKLNTRWEYRYNASCVISSRLKEYSLEIGFNEWHKETIAKIKEEYERNLSEGQAQKWLNMTIKYLFVFSTLLGMEDKRLSKFIGFLTSTDASKYKIPIDGFVLRGSDIKEIKNKTWSKLGEDNSNSYGDVEQELINIGYDFLWELKNWEKFSKKEKKNPDKSTYARYIKDKDYGSY